MKKFNELTAAGQTRRLNKYAAQRKALGLENDLFNIVSSAKISDLNNGDRHVSFRLRRFDKTTQTESFVTGSAYLAYSRKDKSKQEAFFASLKPGDLVSIDYKINGKYIDIRDLMLRHKKVAAKTPVEA